MTLWFCKIHAIISAFLYINIYITYIYVHTVVYFNQSFNESIDMIVHLLFFLKFDFNWHSLWLGNAQNSPVLFTVFLRMILTAIAVISILFSSIFVMLNSFKLLPEYPGRFTSEVVTLWLFSRPISICVDYPP